MTNVLIALEPDAVPYLVALGKGASQWKKLEIA